MQRAIAVLALVALVAPASAMAHATLIRTTPADLSVLDGSPRVVRVEFDDTVHVASGNAAVSNDSGSSVLDGRPRAASSVALGNT